MNSGGNSVVARLACDEPTVRRISNALFEQVDSASSAVAAFEGTDGRWIVELHFETPPDEIAVRGLIGEAGGNAAGVAFETIEPKDWVAASLAGLRPVVTGRFTVHGAHDRAKVATNRLGIQIEAALAFGTGHHGTTRGCLLALDGLLKRRRPRRILDIGTGTGVLAIAAAKALRRGVLASDIDREAVTIARDNARLNGVAPLVECLCANGVAARRFRALAPYDLVLANILLAPLSRLAGPLRPLLAADASVILSGLLARQENAARVAYRAHRLKLVRRIPLGEWVTLVLSV